MQEGLRLIAALLLLSGCGGLTSSAGNIDGGAPSVVPGSIDALRAAFCRTVRACCALSGAPSEPLARCESEFDPQFPFADLVAKGTMILDEGKLGACIARINEQSRTCQSPLTVCYEAFSGKLAQGQACDTVGECKRSNQEPVVCMKTGVSPDSGPKLGVCRPIPVAKSGEHCSETCVKGRDCSYTAITVQDDFDLGLLAVCREEDGLYCNPGIGCAPLSPGGAPCNPFSCASESFCDTVCTPRKGRDTPCASDSECRSDLTCARGICAPQPFATERLCSGKYF